MRRLTGSGAAVEVGLGSEIGGAELLKKIKIAPAPITPPTIPDNSVKVNNVRMRYPRR
jgi:hypothetical protein